MLPGLLRVIFYALLFYVIYRFLRFLLSPGRSARTRPAQNKKSGVMVKDEVCNTYLPKEDAIKEVHEGKEHFFCSQECRQKFLETQDR